MGNGIASPHGRSIIVRYLKKDLAKVLTRRHQSDSALPRPPRAVHTARPFIDLQSAFKGKLIGLISGRCHRLFGRAVIGPATWRG